MKDNTIPKALAVSWIGFFAHNAADLPLSALLGPETIAPTVAYLILLAAWIWWKRRRRHIAQVMMGWGLLHVIGGGLLSVLPLPFWPFDPAQTVFHYAFHAFYAVCQIPLIVVSYRYFGNAGA